MYNNRSMTDGAKPKPKPKPIDWKYVWWCLTGTLIYVFLSFFVVKMIYHDFGNY